MVVGLCYVLYIFMISFESLWIIIYVLGGYFIVFEGGECVGDVSNVMFCNGWICNEKEEVFIYYVFFDICMYVVIFMLD